MDIWAEHQVNWPLTFVNQRKATPRVLLVRLDTTFKHPVLNHEYIGEVGRLLAEAQVSRAIVQSNILGQLQRHNQYWINLTALSYIGCSIE